MDPPSDGEAYWRPQMYDADNSDDDMTLFGLPPASPMVSTSAAASATPAHQTPRAQTPANDEIMLATNQHSAPIAVLNRPYFHINHAQPQLMFFCRKVAGAGASVPYAVKSNEATQTASRSRPRARPLDWASVTADHLHVFQCERGPKIMGILDELGLIHNVSAKVSEKVCKARIMSLTDSRSLVDVAMQSFNIGNDDCPIIPDSLYQSQLLARQQQANDELVNVFQPSPKALLVLTKVWNNFMARQLTTEEAVRNRLNGYADLNQLFCDVEIEEDGHIAEDELTRLTSHRLWSEWFGVKRTLDEFSGTQVSVSASHPMNVMAELLVLVSPPVANLLRAKLSTRTPKGRTDGASSSRSRSRSRKRPSRAAVRPPPAVSETDNDQEPERSRKKPESSSKRAPESRKRDSKNAKKRHRREEESDGYDSSSSSSSSSSSASVSSSSSSSASSAPKKRDSSNPKKRRDTLSRGGRAASLRKSSKRESRHVNDKLNDMGQQDLAKLAALNCQRP